MRPFLILVLCAVVAAAQDGPPRFVVDVPLVSLDVNVTDSSGLPVNALTREDFLVYEDGVLQQIQNFSSVEVPYNVLLLFDCSGSTKPQMELLTAAMTRLTNSLRPQDLIAIAQFGSAVDLRLDWSARSTELVKVDLGAFAGCNNTDFYGAVDWAARKMNGVAGRKGVVVYTDGATRMAVRSTLVAGGRVSRATDSVDDPGFQRVLQAVRSSGASFYFVAVDTDLNPQPGTPASAIYTLQQARARMEQLADVSGARVVFPKNEHDVIPMYERIGRELGTAYSLGYVSSNQASDGRFRSIVVRLRDGTARIRQSRDGYVAP